MRLRLAFSVLLIQLSCRIFAQSTEISSIIPSSSPAFTILGISPIEISRPNNWSALQASLYQNFVSSNQATIPQNFSLEFNPYWLTKHPTFTYDQYLDASGFSLRNLSISLASAKAPFGKDSTQSIGLGFRLPIILGNKRRDKIKADLNTYLSNIRSNLLKFQAELQTFIGNYLVNYGGTTVGNFLDQVDANIKTPPVGSFWIDNKKAIEGLSDTLHSTFGSLRGQPFSSHVNEILSLTADYISNNNRPTAVKAAEEIAKALKETSNWQISGALSLAFPTEKFSYSRYSNAAIWTDYSFKLGKNSPFDGTVALRYLRNFGTVSVGASNNFDAIFRLNLYAGLQNKLTASFWGVLRRKASELPHLIVNNIIYTASTSNWDNKYGLDISYKLSSSVAVSYSVGKNYANANPQNITTLNSNRLINFLNLFYSINTKVDSKGNITGF